MQLYLDEGYAYVAMDTPGMGRSEGVWDPVSRTEGGAIHGQLVDRQDRHDREVTLLLAPVERGADAAGASDVPWRL